MTGRHKIFSLSTLSHSSQFIEKIASLRESLRHKNYLKCHESEMSCESGSQQQRTTVDVWNRVRTEYDF